MIDYIVKTLRFFRKPIFVSGYPETSDLNNLMNWGTDYRSFSGDNIASINNYPEIIFHFPFHPIKIKNYKIRTAIDVFPVEWKIFSSNTGQNDDWEEIAYENKDTCPKNHQFSNTQNQIMCDDYIVNSFQISKPTKYAQYIKFSMLRNSFYDNNKWIYLLHITGIDFGGDCVLITNSKLFQISHSVLAFLCIINK